MKVPGLRFYLVSMDKGPSLEASKPPQLSFIGGLRESCDLINKRS